MKILITGGTGYIGSHVAVQLLEKGHTVIIIDNLCNSKKIVIVKILEITGVCTDKLVFYKGDMLNKKFLDNIFQIHKIDSVIHMAGLKVVAESVKLPLLYYQTNITMVFNLIEIMKKYDCKKLLFSSSATVYGNNPSPVKEDSLTGIGITNAYGRTKYMIEEILKDVSITDDWCFILLRYFNPVGSHISGLIGEDPNGIPNNLMPILLKVASGSDTMKTLNIFGNDYNTKDGTCVRDFIHVEDLARGHVKSIHKIHKKGIHIYNLGTGNGVSVKELIDKFMIVNNVNIPFVYSDRREGDLEKIYCDPSKANNDLEWKTLLTVEDIVRDSWNFKKTN